MRKSKIARTCLDARRVNKWSLTDRSSAPPINESLQKFHGSRFITTTDLSSAFLQIGSKEESRKYTEFLQLKEYSLRVKHDSGTSDFIAHTSSRNPAGLNERELEGLTQPRVFMVSVINLGNDNLVG